MTGAARFDSPFELQEAGSQQVVCGPSSYHRQDQGIEFPIEGKFLLHVQKCKGSIMSIEPFDDLQGEADGVKKVKFQVKDVTNNKG